jgi:hypothetical protein
VRIVIATISIFLFFSSKRAKLKVARMSVPELVKVGVDWFLGKKRILFFVMQA